MDIMVDIMAMVIMIIAPTETMVIEVIIIRPIVIDPPTDTTALQEITMPQYENNNYRSGYLIQENNVEERNGWESLSHNQPEIAQRIFASEAQNNPDTGIPKVGYAVASAAPGDIDIGVWAMRRAFRIDPDSLHYLSLDQGSLDIINNLIHQYREEAFMSSALNYLKYIMWQRIPQLIMP